MAKKKIKSKRAKVKKIKLSKVKPSEFRGVPTLLTKMEKAGLGVVTQHGDGHACNYTFKVIQLEQFVITLEDAIRSKKVSRLRWAIVTALNLFSMTDVQLADEFQVSVPVIRRWAEGKNQPHPLAVPGIFKQLRSMARQVLAAELRGGKKREYKPFWEHASEPEPAKLDLEGKIPVSVLPAINLPEAPQAEGTNWTSFDPFILPAAMIFFVVVAMVCVSQLIGGVV